MSDNKSIQKLPDEFQKYFWDVTFDDLSFKKYSRFIAERILNYANLDEVRWLLSETDIQFIRALVDNSRNLNAKTRNFWQIMLKQSDDKNPANGR